MKREDIKNWIPIAIIILLVIISYLIIKDYLVAIVSGIILSFLVMPIYKWLRKKLSAGISAVLCITLVTIIIVLPIIIVLVSVMNELSTYLSSELLIKVIERITNLDLISWTGLNLIGVRDMIATTILGYIGSLTTKLPQMALSLLVLVISMFYFLKDWNKITTKIKKYIPSENKDKVSKEIAKITKAVVYGSLLVALIEFVISLVGFWLLGSNYSLIFATLIAIFSFLPALGPVIIWLPVAVIALLQGDYLVGIGVLILGAILTIYADTILRAKLSGRGTQVHPITMIIGIVGGIALFGIAGFVIGPLILSYTLTLLEDLMSN